MSGDSTIWTGTWVGAEALRYCATGDPEALACMEHPGNPPPKLPW